MAWQLTKSLTRFRTLVNERWPNRDHASDGTIGDTAHQAETSGHNPDDTAGSSPAWDGDPDSTPEVRAFDMDSDLGEAGTTAQMLVDHLRKLPNLASVIRYMIYNRVMYHSRDSFEPTAYTGSSAHTEHIHFEGAWSQAGDDNVTFDFKLDEVGNMALTTDDAIKVWNTDTSVPMPSWRSDKPTNPTIMGASAMVIAMDEAHGANVGAAALKSQVAALSSQVTALGNALLNAIAASKDTDALASAIAATLTPAVVASLAETVPDLATLDSAEVQAACETAIRAVLGELG